MKTFRKGSVIGDTLEFAKKNKGGFTVQKLEESLLYRHKISKATAGNAVNRLCKWGLIRPTATMEGRFKVYKLVDKPSNIIKRRKELDQELDELRLGRIILTSIDNMKRIIRDQEFQLEELKGKIKELNKVIKRLEKDNLTMSAQLSKERKETKGRTFKVSEVARFASNVP